MRSLRFALAGVAVVSSSLLLSACSGDDGTNAGNTPVASDSPDAVADWIFHNGTVLTMDPGLPRAEAIAVSGDEIAAVGGDAEILALADESTRIVDLDGGTLMPGFIDAHAHYAGLFEGDVQELQDWILSMGVTTAAELAVGPELLAQMRGWEAAGELRVRWDAYLTVWNACGEAQGDWYRQHSPTEDPGAMLRIAGVKLYADGGSCGVPAGTRPDGSPYGDLWFSDDQLVSEIDRLDAEGYQIAVHALGDRAIDQVLTAYEQVLGEGGNPLRHRIEHNTIVDPSFATRYDDLGLTGTIFGAYPTCTFAELIETQGEAAFEKEWNWRRLLDGNPETRFGWASDALLPLFPDPSPARSLMGFTSREERADDGTICEPSATQLQGSLSMDEALRTMTVGGAYALRREAQLGTLEPGKLADLTIWSDDPTMVDPELLLDSTVMLTMVGGAPEHCVDEIANLCD